MSTVSNLNKVEITIFSKYILCLISTCLAFNLQTFFTFLLPPHYRRDISRLFSFLLPAQRMVVDPFGFSLLIGSLDTLPSIPNEVNRIRVRFRSNQPLNVKWVACLSTAELTMSHSSFQFSQELLSLRVQKLAWTLVETKQKNTGAPDSKGLGLHASALWYGSLQCEGI